MVEFVLKLQVHAAALWTPELQCSDLNLLLLHVCTPKYHTGTMHGSSNQDLQNQDLKNDTCPFKISNSVLTLCVCALPYALSKVACTLCVFIKAIKNQ